LPISISHLLVPKAQLSSCVSNRRRTPRVAFLRLTDEGERRLARVFTHLDVEREQLRRAVASLDG
jgi:hypothetical protein